LNPPPLITFAVHAEAAPARRLLHQCQIPSRLLITGIGALAARAAVLRTLDDSLPPFVLTCGFAGGLDPALPGGRLVYEADPDFPLSNRMSACDAARVAFLASDRILSSATEKAAARDQSHADAVEMESFAIRQLCRERGIPSATFRVISDSAREDLPLDFTRFLTSSGRFRYEQLAIALLRSPARIPPLIRFQRQTREAANILASGLCALFQ
jgi:adenosylhomocysteine nucleosidase